jgi:hypothetical protein
MMMQAARRQFPFGGRGQVRSAGSRRRLDDCAAPKPRVSAAKDYIGPLSLIHSACHVVGGSRNVLLGTLSS